MIAAVESNGGVAAIADRAILQRCAVAGKNDAVARDVARDLEGVQVESNAFGERQYRIIGAVEVAGQGCVLEQGFAARDTEHARANDRHRCRNGTTHRPNYTRIPSARPSGRYACGGRS